MDSNILNEFPGYSFSEYQLTLRPNSHLKEKIQIEKRAFSITYKVENSMNYPVQLLLSRFIQLDMREGRLISGIKNIASACAPFLIELKDFGSFPSHTLFLKVASKQSILNLVKKIKTAQRLMTIKNINRPWFVHEPYIIIAAKLSVGQYQKGWKEYRHRHFFEKFTADQIHLMKRSYTQNAGGKNIAGKFETVEKFAFMNMHESKQQGKLFQ